MKGKVFRSFEGGTRGDLLALSSGRWLRRREARKAEMVRGRGSRGGEEVERRAEKEVLLVTDGRCEGLIRSNLRLSPRDSLKKDHSDPGNCQGIIKCTKYLYIQHNN